jgi:predicted nucleic acid-binding protein
MSGFLVDSCVLLDLFTDDPNWADWSENILGHYGQTNTLFINSIIYTEISIGFNRIEEVEAVLEQAGIKVLEIPREVLFLAGKVFLKYRKTKGNKQSTLPDFYIGAHAIVSALGLITRDVSKFNTYFPNLHLISPRTFKA